MQLNRVTIVTRQMSVGKNIENLYMGGMWKGTLVAEQICSNIV